MFWFRTIYCNAIGTGIRCREIYGWPTCAAVSQTPSPVIRAKALLAAANRASSPFSSVQIKARINLGSTADRVQTISLFFFLIGPPGRRLTVQILTANRGHER